MTNEELVQLFQRGERQYIEDLWRQNRGLIRKYARNYASPRNPIEDLEQIGFMGLLKAAEGFDPTLGWKFTSYASKAIMGAMYRSLFHTNDVSLDEDLGDEENFTRSDTISDENAPDPEAAGINADYRRIIITAMNRKLNQSEKTVLIKMYFKDEDNMAEIARKFGVTNERVRQIHNKALRILRQDHHIWQIREEFLDVNTDYYGYRTGSLGHFKETGYSSVERIIEKREERRRKAYEKLGLGYLMEYFDREREENGGKSSPEAVR